MDKYRIEIECDEWNVADALSDISNLIEFDDLFDQMKDGSLKVKGDNYVAEIKLINK